MFAEVAATATTTTTTTTTLLFFQVSCIPFAESGHSAAANLLRFLSAAKII